MSSWCDQGLHLHPVVNFFILKHIKDYCMSTNGLLFRNSEFVYYWPENMPEFTDVLTSLHSWVFSNLLVIRTNYLASVMIYCVTSGDNNLRSIPAGMYCILKRLSTQIFIFISVSSNELSFTLSGQLCHLRKSWSLESFNASQLPSRSPVPWIMQQRTNIKSQANTACYCCSIRFSDLYHVSTVGPALQTAISLENYCETAQQGTLGKKSTAAHGLKCDWFGRDRPRFNPCMGRRLIVLKSFRFFYMGLLPVAITVSSKHCVPPARKAFRAGRTQKGCGQ